MTSSLARATLYKCLKAFCMERSRAHLSVHEARSSPQSSESMSRRSLNLMSVGRGGGLLSSGSCARLLLYSTIKGLIFLERLLISLIILPEALVPNCQSRQDTGKTMN